MDKESQSGVEEKGGSSGEIDPHEYIYNRQLANKRRAFRRMAESLEFTKWAHTEAFRNNNVDRVVDRMMQPENLKVEYWDVSSKGWQEVE